MPELSIILQNKLNEQFCCVPEYGIYMEEGSQRDCTCNSNTYSLLLVLNGKLSIHIEDTAVSLSKESGLLLPPDISYSLTSTENCQFHHITFSGDLAETILSETLAVGNYLNSAAFFYLIRDLKCLKNFSNEQSDHAFYSLSLLLHLYKNTKPLTEPLYPPLVSAAIHLMEENYTYLYGIEELAEQLEISKNHLIRQFHDSIGISPGRYLTNVKINHAKELLQTGETSLELIAVTCGFSGASYFRKVFKKETGLSPSEFRKKEQAGSSRELPKEFYL